MFGLFKFLLYLGVLASIVGFVLPRVSDHPAVVDADLPPETPRYLAFGGLGLIVLGMAGRSATRPEPSDQGEWK